LRYHLTMFFHSRVHVRKVPPENMPPEKTPPENMPPEGADMKVFDGFASPR